MRRVEIDRAVKRMRDDGNLMTIAERDALIEGLVKTLRAVERILEDEEVRRSESARDLAFLIQGAVDRGEY